MIRAVAAALVLATAVLGAWLWARPGRPAAPPAPPTLAAFIERVGLPELWWDLQRDDPGYGDRVAAGVKKQLGEAAAGLIKVDGHRFAMQADARLKYHGGLAGWQSLPHIGLSGARAVSVEVSYRAELEGRIYWNLYWCNEQGERLADHSLEYLRIFVTGDKRKGPITETFEHIAVPCRAGSLRIEPAFAPMAMEITGLRVFAHRAITEPLAAAAPAPGSGVCAFPPTSGGPAPDVLGRGLEVIVADPDEVVVLDRQHQPARIDAGMAWYLHQLACHTILVRTTAGWEAWQFTGADSVTVARHAHELRIVAREYDFGERSLQVLPPEVVDGTVRDPNLGVAGELPAGRLEVHRHPGVDWFLFPTWQPEGRLATLVLSEHADLVNTDHQLAVLFGKASEERQDGIGIVGNRIPLSTTVWALGALANVAVPIEGFTYRYSTLDGDPRLGEVYRRLRESGFPLEIGLHTAGPNFDSPAETRRGLERMRAFDSELWIDHSFFNNLECLVRSGWNRRGYDLPRLLREFGYRFAWAGSEKVADELDLLRPQVAANAWFRVPRIEQTTDWSLTLFSTVQTQLARIKPEQLDALQQNRGLSFIHIYTALYSVDDQGNLRADANATLQGLARRRDRGDLHLTTIAGFAAHHDLMRRARWSPDRDGFTISGPDDLFTRGATFGFVSVGQTAPVVPPGSSRREGPTTYFWALPAATPGEFQVRVLR